MPNYTQHGFYYDPALGSLAPRGHAKKPAGGAPPAGGPIINLDEGSGTSDPVTTASISPTSGCHLYLAVAMAGSSSSPGNSMTITGVAATWTEIVSIDWGGRRTLTVFRGTGTMTPGTIEINYTGGATWQETAWSVNERTDPNTSTPDNAAGDTFTTNQSAPGSTLTTVGTPGTGDIVFCVACVETSGGDSLAFQASLEDNLLSSRLSMNNVRAMKVAFDDDATPDDTPSATWSSNSNNVFYGLLIYAP